MNIVLYTTLEKPFIKEWVSLWEHSSDANYVNSPFWFLSILDTFQYKTYTIIAIYKNTHLAAVAAIVKEKKYGIDFYTMPPGDFVYGIPFLVDLQDKELVNALIKQLSDLGNMFFENVPETLVSIFATYIPHIASTPSSVNYYLSIEQDHKEDVIIANRKKLMYRSRHVEKNFTLTSYTGDIPEALDIAFTIDSQSRKQSRGYSAFADKSIQDFYVSLAKNFGKYFSTNILRFDDKPVAYRIGFIINNTFFASQIAFLSEYGSYSPGNVLLVKFLETFGKKHIKKLDFGSGDNYFKRSFTKTSRPLYSIVISKNLFIRKGIICLYQQKDVLFNKIRQHVKIYLFYRNIKKMLKI